MTPGIQPKRVKRKTMSIEPQPLSQTAKGGKTIAKTTLQMLNYSNSTVKLYFSGLSSNSIMGTLTVMILPSRL